MDYKGLGQRIREYRAKMNITQERLAEAVELSTVYISQIETGIRKPSLSTIVSIANELRVPIECLLKDSVDINDSVKRNELLALLEGRSDKELELAIDTLRAVLSHIKDDALS